MVRKLLADGATGYTADPYLSDYESIASSWAGHLDSALGADWTVINAGNSGTGSTYWADNFETLVTKHRPTHVVLGMSFPNGSYSTTTFMRDMHRLCEMCENIGAKPIIMGTYPRDDMNATQLEKTLAVNRALQSMGYPLIERMARLDAGDGVFVAGHSDDGVHPNDAGHLEFFKDIDLGLFTHGHKHIPSRLKGYMPDATDAGISFSGLTDPNLNTYSVRMRVDASSASIVSREIISATSSTTPFSVSVDASGNLTLAGGGATLVTSAQAINDTGAYDIILTVNAAKNAVRLVVDDTEVATITPTETLGGLTAVAMAKNMTGATLSNIALYRTEIPTDITFGPNIGGMVYEANLAAYSATYMPSTIGSNYVATASRDWVVQDG